MKKNVLFILIDSVTNDVLFNKSNSEKIAPFMNSLRKESVSGDKMYSEAPYTEAALMALLGSVDTMDNGGYMERMKNTKGVLEVFKENGYKVFFSNYYPSIYPSQMVKGFDERKYIEGFQFAHIWEYRFKYFAPLYKQDKLSEREKTMLEDMLEDNFAGWIEYLEKIKDNHPETEMLNGNMDISNIDKDIVSVKEQYDIFLKDKRKYIGELFGDENHILFKIPTYMMTDKVHNDGVKEAFKERYIDTFNRIDNLNFKNNLKNNNFPLKKALKSAISGDNQTFKGLLAGYKNSLKDKDLYDRINGPYDTFKVQRSFRCVSEVFYRWLDEQKEDGWMSYIHVDDAHFNESFFTYDTDNMGIIDGEFKRINEYLDSLPKDYKGSITYDLSLLYCDSIVENIFNELKKRNLLDDTSVVITADHGFSYYFSPVRERYVISNYAENYNVPFLVWEKNIEKKTIEHFCSTKDIPATLLDMAGIEIPDCFKGKSLLKWNGGEYALLEYMGGGCPDIKRRPINLGVRTDNYSVVLNIYVNKDFEEREIVEVYDLRKDRNEHCNLKNKKNIERLISKELEILKMRFSELQKQYRKDR